MTKKEFLSKYFINWNIGLSGDTIAGIHNGIFDLIEKNNEGSCELLAHRKANLYAYYISLVEIFIINYLVIRDENIEPLFEGALQNRINSFLGDDMKFNKLVEACFASNLDGLSDPEETKDQYRKIIQIAFSNYEKDFDYLNAHKHGRRVIGYWKDFNNSNGDSLIFYYKKSKQAEDTCISLVQSSIQFNWENISLFCRFLIDALDNMRRIYLNEGITTTYITIENKYILEKINIHRDEKNILNLPIN